MLIVDGNVALEMLCSLNATFCCFKAKLFFGRESFEFIGAQYSFDGL